MRTCVARSATASREEVSTRMSLPNDVGAVGLAEAGAWGSGDRLRGRNGDGSGAGAASAREGPAAKRPA